MPKKPFAGKIPFDPINGALASYAEGWCNVQWAKEYDEVTKKGKNHYTSIEFNLSKASEIKVERGPFHNQPADLIIVRYGYEWREDVPFEDTMKIEGYGRGRSSAVFNLKSKKTGAEYQSFMSDTLTIITHTDFKAGSLTARWQFAKKGTNYGLQLA